MILPRRSPTEYDYRYFLRELNMSAELSLPCVVMAEEETTLPPSLAKRATRVSGNFSSWLTETPGPQTRGGGWPPAPFGPAAPPSAEEVREQRQALALRHARNEPQLPSVITERFGDCINEWLVLWVPPAADIDIAVIGEPATPRAAV